MAIKENRNIKLLSSDTVNDKIEILRLMKRVLVWADTKETITLLPAVADAKNSSYIGFDLEQHKKSLVKLKKTNFFATEFIKNYNQIILTLDKKLRNGDYGEWLVGDLPPFIFVNDYDPWWDGQERFSLQNAVIETIYLDGNKGEFSFKCGDKENGCEGIEGYYMKFKAIKEGKSWKIAYMGGFDYKRAVTKDGELK